MWLIMFWFDSLIFISWFSLFLSSIIFFLFSIIYSCRLVWFSLCRNCDSQKRHIRRKLDDLSRVCLFFIKWLRQYKWPQKLLTINEYRWYQFYLTANSPNLTWHMPQWSECLKCSLGQTLLRTSRRVNLTQYHFMIAVSICHWISTKASSDWHQSPSENPK